MARYLRKEINRHLSICDNGSTNHEKGHAFEDLVCYLFDNVPGISISQRNQLNAFENEEIDIALWNEKAQNGLYFLPHIVLVECKNWSKPVSSSEISWFLSKLTSRGLDFGILVANNGITGSPAELTAAHNTIALHLAQKRQMIVFTREDIINLGDATSLVNLTKQKLCKLAVSGTIL